MVKSFYTLSSSSRNLTNKAKTMAKRVLALAALLALCSARAFAERSFTNPSSHAARAARADLFRAKGRCLSILSSNTQDPTYDLQKQDVVEKRYGNGAMSVLGSTNGESFVVEGQLELAVTAAKKMYRDGRLRYNPSRIDDARALALGARASALIARREALDAMRSKSLQHE